MTSYVPEMNFDDPMMLAHLDETKAMDQDGSMGLPALKAALPTYLSETKDASPAPSKTTTTSSSTPMSMSASSTPASRKRMLDNEDDSIVPSFTAAVAAESRPSKRAFVAADAAEPFPTTPLVDNPDLLSVAAQNAARHILAKVDRTLVLDVDHPSYADFKNEPVNVPLDIYITRLVKLFKSDATIVAAAVIYMDRLLANNERLKLTEVNTHRLTFLCLMAASKVMSDIPYNNKYMARVSGTWSLPRVNKMEHEFLRLINFELYVSREESSRTIRRLTTDM